ncbi:FAD:protein FMN transferase [Robiginitalea sp.]|nr:FAD:protein FMN transferase [Robiginitalea sp.]
MDLWRFRVDLVVVLLTMVVLYSCNTPSALQRQDYRGGALGTTYAIITYSESSIDFTKGIDSVFAVFNQSMSTYIPDSDISKINLGDSTVQVDPMFREVFEQARKIWEASEGYFDPTVGILVDAWGFGPGKALEMDTVTVDSLLRYVGFEKVRLTQDLRIVKEYPQIRLDFNAIAKGYSIDRLSEMIQAAGVQHYLIEVGGELRTGGMNPDKGQPWNVGIDDPRVTDGRSVMRIVALSDKAMASSGNYRKFRVDPQTGGKFVHTIDPHTGFTRSSNILATSVIAPNCMIADAYATTLMAMELRQSKELLQAHKELEGYIVYLDDAGNLQEYITPGFKDLILP